MKVAICTPVYDHPKALYTTSLAAMLIHTARHAPEIDLKHILSQGHLIRNRNTLLQAATKWGADYILWIDADMAFPENTLVQLLSHGHRVIGCNAPTRDNPPKPTAFREVGPKAFQGIFTTPEIAARKPVEEVTHIGLGVTLIATDALSRLPAPVFRPKQGDADGLAEDVDLCNRLREAGERIYIDHVVSLRVGHLSETMYTNMHAAQAAS